MNIKDMSSTMTAHQMIAKLRSKFTDENILVMAKDVSRGIYEAFEAIINKEVAGTYSLDEREENEYKDGWDE